jgi:hypothetical protein
MKIFPHQLQSDPYPRNSTSIPSNPHQSDPTASNSYITRAATMSMMWGVAVVVESKERKRHIWFVPLTTRDPTPQYSHLYDHSLVQKVANGQESVILSSHYRYPMARFSPLSQVIGISGDAGDIGLRCSKALRCFEWFPFYMVTSIIRQFS